MIKRIIKAPIAPVRIAFTIWLEPMLTFSALNTQLPTKLPMMPTTTLPIRPIPFPFTKKLPSQPAEAPIRIITTICSSVISNNFNV